MSNDIVPPSARREALSRRRCLKMAESPHAYVRGNALHFYERLKSDVNPKTLPVGPPIWICGDCHIGNLGPIADLDGDVEIQIRDLDQTVVGNPALDLLRLGLSLAMAARSSDLPGVTTALMVEAIIEGYAQKLLGRGAKDNPTDISPIEKVMRSALKRRWRNLAEERIEDVSPEIPLGSRFWPLTEQERQALKHLLEGESQAESLTRLTRSDKDDSIKMLDAAYWVKGCSSLGRLRYAALVKAGEKHRLIDVKEAIRPLAPQAEGAEVPANNAERIVAGACHLSPFLGERMIATTLIRHQVVLRELRPQDIKFDLATFTQAEATEIARLFARVVGKAHGRQMKHQERLAWARDLKRGRTKSLDAPSWLWNAVVDLVATHESSYLSHCRKFALSSLFRS